MFGCNTQYSVSSMFEYSTASRLQYARSIHNGVYAFGYYTQNPDEFLV